MDGYTDLQMDREVEYRYSDSAVVRTNCAVVNTQVVGSNLVHTCVCWMWVIHMS